MERSRRERHRHGEGHEPACDRRLRVQAVGARQRRIEWRRVDLATRSKGREVAQQGGKAEVPEQIEADRLGDDHQGGGGRQQAEQHERPGHLFAPANPHVQTDHDREHEISDVRKAAQELHQVACKGAHDRGVDEDHQRHRGLPVGRPVQPVEHDQIKLQQVARDHGDGDRKIADLGQRHLHQDQADRPQPDHRPVFETQLDVAAADARAHPRRSCAGVRSAKRGTLAAIRPAPAWAARPRAVRDETNQASRCS